MKDKIFIIWSGGTAAAHKVKTILENNHNYICMIGGGFGSKADSLTVGDTVIRQMKLCNQAIVIFQKKSGGEVSDNLYFELGFVTAMYGFKKVHCVCRKGETIALPSDFDNSFIEMVDGTDDDSFAESIVRYFLKRQKLSVDVNKMSLINNRHTMHDMIQAHYSDMGSRCSDYELAQYILFYMQAAVMFQDDSKALEELRDFKRRHNMEFSKEIAVAVNLSIALLEVQVGLNNADGTVYLGEASFRKYYNACKNLLEEIDEDDSGTFDEWARTFATENISYACCLYSQNPDTPESMRNSLLERTIRYAKKALESMEKLERVTPVEENNDDVGLIALFRAYVYRHLFIASKYLDNGEAGDWLSKALKQRAQLVRTFSDQAVDSTLYMNFEMEYYLVLVEYLNYTGKENIDPFEYEMYLSEIDEFIARIERNNSIHAFAKAVEQQRHQID